MGQASGQREWGPYATVGGFQSRFSSERPVYFYAARGGQREAWMPGSGRAEQSRNHTCSRPHPSAGTLFLNYSRAKVMKSNLIESN